MNNEIWFWILFFFFVVGMLILDIGVFHKRPHAISFKEAGIWTVIWILLAALFNVGIFLVRGREPGVQFLTSYLIEKTLSVDNIFVFLMIFSYFEVPQKYQHKILFFGVLGAIIMRALMIVFGISLINTFHWMIYVFGGFLILTGFKMLISRKKQPDVKKNVFYRGFTKLVRMTPDYHEGHFVVKKHGRWFATPLALVLVLIEASDLVFALDSIPAILSISSDAMIVYTSNIFAIFGLRSIYFIVSRMLQLFKYLEIALAFILVFVGVKMAISDVYHIPVAVALSVVVGVTTLAIVYSWWEKKSRA